MSGLSDDLLDGDADDENIGYLLKSLISTNGLQTTWQSVAKRIQTLEQGLRRAQHTIQKIPQQYVKREEFNDKVESQHGRLLHDHGENLKHSKEDIEKLSASDKQHALRLQTCLASLGELENQVQTKVDNLERLHQDFSTEVMHRFKASSREFSNHFEKLTSLTEQFKKQVEDGLVEIRETEHTMQISTDQKIYKNMQNLCHNKSTPEATQLLSFISQWLVEPLAAEVARTGGEIAALTQNFAKQEERFLSFRRSQEKAMFEMSVQLQHTNQELEEQLNLCTKKVDADQAKDDLDHGLEALSRENANLRSKILDHDQCLHRHAEEIKNRGTKQEVLTCRNQVDNCASKAEFHRELGELKKIMSWQSEKIDTIGLNGGSMGPRKHFRQGRSKLHSRRSSADGESSSEASYGGTSSVGHQPLIPRRRFSTEPEPEESVQPMLGNVEEADEVIVVSEPEKASSNCLVGDSERHRSSIEVAAVSEPQKAPSRRLVGDSGHHNSSDEEVIAVSGPQKASSRCLVGDSDGDDSSSEQYASSSTLVLRRQIEAIAMGVLGLAHLTLKEVRLGTSRNARLAQEKEMLQELANVRHWITNKVVPSGWDPSKITTLALRCTHPREDERKGPSPQVPLKSLLEPNDESRVPQKRHASLAPRVGAKVPGDSGSDVPNHPPFSTKGHPGATRLPPLEGLVASN